MRRSDQDQTLLNDIRFLKGVYFLCSIAYLCHMFMDLVYDDCFVIKDFLLGTKS
jgi:hypothetical protein